MPAGLLVSAAFVGNAFHACRAARVAPTWSSRRRSSGASWWRRGVSPSWAG